jgi:hypothetical protein
MDMASGASDARLDLALEQAVTANAAEAMAVPLRKARRSILVQSAITHSKIAATAPKPT